MLKAQHTILAVAAALGMSSLFAQTPGPTYTVSQAAALWGYMSENWTRGTNGNTNTFSYQPSSGANGVPSTNANSNYTVLKRFDGGFTLEQKGYSPVPGKDLAHPIALRKPVPNSSMAKAFAKTIPIVGNAFAMYELLDYAFSEPIRFNEQADRYEYQLPVSSCTPPTSSTQWCQSLAYLFNGSPTGTLQVLSTTATQCTYRHACSGLNKSNQPATYYSPNYTTNLAPAQWQPISEQLAESKIGTLLDWPPLVDDLLPSVPDQALRDLAEDNRGPGFSVIPYTADGQPSLLPWVSPGNITESQVDQLGQQPQRITTTTTSTIRATPVQDGIRYDTTTTSQTQTQPLDPVTGQPAIDPVTGLPVTPTTTTTSTTTAPVDPPPAPSEDLECGLPGTPPCKIDETGTPEADSANLDQADQEIENFKSGLAAKVQEKLDEIVHEWTWSFALPTGCSSLQFDTQVGPIVEIDMCQHQPMIHDIMSMLWAAAGVFGALMIFLRANG